MRYLLSFAFMVGCPLVLYHLSKWKNIARVFLYACIITILIITLGSRSADVESHVVLNPFHVYHIALKVIVEGVQKYGWSEFGKRLWWYRYQFGNIGLNIFLFMPLGYLAPLNFSQFNCWWKVLMLGFLSSLLIETLQLTTHLGWFDTSDILHNWLGVIIGYWIYHKWLKKKQDD